MVDVIVYEEINIPGEVPWYWKGQIIFPPPRKQVKQLNPNWILTWIQTQSKYFNIVYSFSPFSLLWVLEWSSVYFHGAYVILPRLLTFRRLKLLVELYRGAYRWWSHQGLWTFGKWIWDSVNILSKRHSSRTHYQALSSHFCFRRGYKSIMVPLPPPSAANREKCARTTNPTPSPPFVADWGLRQ